jgi:hypothetical protein
LRYCISSITGDVVISLNDLTDKKKIQVMADARATLMLKKFTP